MYMGKAGWVCNDGFRDERPSGDRIWSGARLPTAFQYLSNHFSFLLYVARLQALHARDQPRVLDHVGHELSRVAANGIELETGLADKFVKDIVRSQTDAMPVPYQLGAEGYEGLDVATASNNLDDDIEFEIDRQALGVSWRLFDVPGIIRGGFWRYTIGDQPAERMKEL